MQQTAKFSCILCGNAKSKWLLTQEPADFHRSKLRSIMHFKTPAVFNIYKQRTVASYPFHKLLLQCLNTARNSSNHAFQVASFSPPRTMKPLLPHKTRCEFLWPSVLHLSSNIRRRTQHLPDKNIHPRKFQLQTTLYFPW